MSLREEKLTPITSNPGFEHGINYKELATAFPYMYTDKPETVEFLADANIIDQIIDWFGKDIRIVKEDEKTLKVSVKVSLRAMEHWAMQYINYVEIISPQPLRERMRNVLENGLKKYK